MDNFVLRNELRRMDDLTIRGNLKKRRQELGLTQTEMASRLDISLNAYRKLEKGPTLLINQQMDKFAKATGISLAELVNGFEPSDPGENNLNDLRNTYEQRLGSLKNEYSSEILRLQKENETLAERISDKNNEITAKDKLIAFLEKRVEELERRVEDLEGRNEG